MCCCLLLVASGSSATTGTLELPALGPDQGLDVRVGHTGGAEPLVGLARLTRSLQQHRVLASRGFQGQLVKGDDLTTGLDDPAKNIE